MTRWLVALALHVGVLTLGAGCMDTRTASLGIEAQRGSPVVPDAAAPDAATLPSRDAGVADAGVLDERVDAGDHEGDRDDADHHDDDGEDDDPVDHGGNAVVDPRDAGLSPVALDAGVVPAGTVDARAADTSVGHNDERDGAREDARAPVNPLCIAEPWHCQ